MSYTWQTYLPAETREAASRDVDDRIVKGQVVGDMVESAFVERQRTGQPHPDWIMPLVGRGLGLSRTELQGLRWLAGKMLHFGPLAATEMRQWRAGEEPRCKWRSSEAIYPPDLLEQRPGQRALYDKHLAGRDVVGTLNLTGMLIEIEHEFFRLVRRAGGESR